MKERPILFSGPMVRAILDGTKTQTRRVAKPRFDDRTPCSHWGPAGDRMTRHCEHGSEGQPCPYGAPGDRLWVRETWCAEWRDDAYGILYRAGGLDVAGNGYSWEERKCPAVENAIDYSAWRPSIYMPRWASRILLEIEDVRVERVQDISEEDALDEGIDNYDDPARQVFADLWDSINAKRGFSWESNPWVWVIQFRRITD